MIAGILVGLFAIWSLAFLTWQLVKTHKKQELDQGSRGFRTMMIGFGYTLQLGVVVYLSTAGKAYLWFRESQKLEKADSPYVIGIVIGIFLGAISLYWLVRKNEKSL